MLREGYPAAVPQLMGCGGCGGTMVARTTHLSCPVIPVRLRDAYREEQLEYLLHTAQWSNVQLLTLCTSRIRAPADMQRSTCRVPRENLRLRGAPIPRLTCII